jgi:hypothetical protein
LGVEAAAAERARRARFSCGEVACAAALCYVLPTDEPEIFKRIGTAGDLWKFRPLLGG